MVPVVVELHLKSKKLNIMVTIMIRFLELFSADARAQGACRVKLARLTVETGIIRLELWDLVFDVSYVHHVWTPRRRGCQF